MLLKNLACHWSTWSQMTGCPSSQFKPAPHKFKKSDNQIHKAELATQQHWLSCFYLLKIYSLWKTVQLLWESSWHNVQIAKASSSMKVTVLLGVAVMKPPKSTGLTNLNWTNYKPLHTITCIPFLPQLPTVYSTYNSGSYVHIYIKCSSSVSLCTCPQLMKYTCQTVTSGI